MEAHHRISHEIGVQTETDPVGVGATRHLVPIWQDLQVLDPVSKALGPLVEFTNALSAENYSMLPFYV